MAKICHSATILMKSWVLGILVPMAQPFADHDRMLLMRQIVGMWASSWVSSRLSVCAVLQQRGVCLDSVSSAGDTALQCAIKHGCLLSAVMLIQALSRQQFTRVLPSLRRLQVTACLQCVYSRPIQTRQRSHRSHSWISDYWQPHHELYM